MMNLQLRSLKKNNSNLEGTPYAFLRGCLKVESMKQPKKIFDVEAIVEGEVLTFTLQRIKPSEIIEYSQTLYEVAKSPQKLADLRIEYGLKLINDFPADQFTDENDKPVLCDEAGRVWLKENFGYLLINIAVKYIDLKLGIDISTKGESPLPLANSSANGSELVQPKRETDALKTRANRKKD